MVQQRQYIKRILNDIFNKSIEESPRGYICNL